MAVFIHLCIFGVFPKHTDTQLFSLAGNAESVGSSSTSFYHLVESVDRDVGKANPDIELPIPQHDPKKLAKMDASPCVP